MSRPVCQNWSVQYWFTTCIALFLVACSGGNDRQSAGQPAPDFLAEPAESLRILVIGGTSGIGRETVRLGLERDHLMTAMSRNPERVTLTSENLQIIKGDILDPGSVDGAVKDQDAVVISIGAGPTRKPVSLFSAGTRNVLASMSKFNVNRLIVVTGIGAGDSRGHGGFFYDRIFQPLLLKTIYEDKDREEDLIRESNTTWTIVRPGFLNDDTSEIRYRVISNLEGITSGSIARADVGHFIVAELELGRHTGQTVLLTN